MRAKRIIVVGGGIVGLATALKLIQRFPKVEVVVLEKEAVEGCHQSGNNSGVLHAGLYYEPGSLKARLAVAGIQEMTAFCQGNDVRHEICGKLVAGWSMPWKFRVCVPFMNAGKKTVSGASGGFLNRQQMLEIEPNVAGVEGGACSAGRHRGLRPSLQCYAAKNRKRRRKSRLRRQSHPPPCLRFRLRGGKHGWRVGRRFFWFPTVPACIATGSPSFSAGEKRDVRIVPFRGEYFTIKPERQHLVRHLIYPVPDPQFPFLGVHFTRLIEGGVEAGPNAVLALAREGYTKTSVNLADMYDALSFPGLWRFMAQHKRMSWEEIKRSFSRRLFCHALRRLVPAIRVEDLQHGGAGVRAQAMSPEGELLQDFCLVQRPNALHVLNAPSPGATASLAIGGEIAAQVVAAFSVNYRVRILLVEPNGAKKRGSMTLGKFFQKSW